MNYCIADVIMPPGGDGLSLPWVIILILVGLGLAALFVAGKLKRRRIAAEERAAAAEPEAAAEEKK